MRVYTEVKMELYTFSASIPDRGKWVASFSNLFNPG
jgi:hypothetical protein